MNDLELKIKLSNEYDICFERARVLTNLRKCHCWFDRKSVANDEVTITLTLQDILLDYCTSKGRIQESCTYDSVLSVTEMHDGVLVRLSHKRLLFLPAANDRKNTQLLMQAVAMLGKRCKYIYKQSNLRINEPGVIEQINFRLRPKQGHYVGATYEKGALILLICMAVLIATIFVLQPVNNRIVPESEAVALAVTFSGCDPSYRRGQIKYIDLVFEDYEELTVDGCCSNSDLVERLAAVPAGTQIHLLLHPQSKNVLQINVNNEILLEFVDAQNRIWREAIAFAVLGLLLYVAAAGLLVGMIRKKG